MDKKMTSFADRNNPAVGKKLAENLQMDLRSLSSESRRKHNNVKEAAETGLLKIKTITAKSADVIPGLVTASVEIVHPFVLGCDTKNPKIVHMCLTSMQRLIQHEALSVAAANSVISSLWLLMEAGVEELKLLQTAILLITTNTVVQHEALAKAVVLCFRLHFTKDSTTMNTAAATVCQLVNIIFDRVTAEDAVPPEKPPEPVSTEALKAGGRVAPKSLRPCAGDAFLLFQDFCQLVNADQPHWLVGMTEMTRTFGLELMETVLTTYPAVFTKHPEFSFLLKEKVCPLVIKLFSPSLKYRPNVTPPSSTPASPTDKPYFPIVMRLMRIVSVLIKHYYHFLATECEIFLSLLVKFLDGEKPMWQRALALEVLYKLMSQPCLIRNFCVSYDMKQHSTKIFRDIVNGLGAFVQFAFMNPPSTSTHTTTGKGPDTQGQPPALVAGMPVGGGVSPQPAFCYRSVWIPLVINVSQQLGTHKTVFMDMMDKVDPPSIPDGYGLSIAFVTLLEIVRCVQSLVEGTGEDDSSRTDITDTSTADEDTVKKLHVELVNSSWCGVLAALSLLLDASTDESATEAILKSEQALASMCGRLDLNTPRDAFITALCKASLPPHYTLTVLSTHPSLHRQGSGNQNPVKAISSQDAPSATHNQDMFHGSQVVAVGTPLPTASLPLGAQQGPVMLTAKNIQCMRSLLSLAHCHGSILGTAWHQVLTTLQHLVWILGLKPSSGGSLKATQQASDNPNAVITTAVMADLPVISSMLSRLFESSQYLDDVALHHLIDALCKLSSEAMELAYSNREPSLFAVAKLLETGLVNLPRVEVLWRPVTAHLLEVCQHPHHGMRAWGAEAVTSLTRAALTYNFTPPLHEQTKLQGLLLAPLQELSAIMHPDIRNKQLECVLQILHSNGDRLHKGWPVILSVIGAVTNEQGDTLIRVAFQSLQLVVTDFLPTMPCSCLQICVEVASRFGLQSQELNISLTAIGLLWNISDYFSQNQASIKQGLTDETPDTSSLSKDGKAVLPAFDGLWMCLYMKLGELCVDQRPAVRKSAGQTLFSTIAAHGALLQQASWQTLLWQVLFALLDQVKKLSQEAPGVKDMTQGQENILMHHSRDTAEKQWAETCVLTLAGVARVFNMKRRILHKLGDFPRAWALLLEFIEASALNHNAEVSLAALKSFQEILLINKDSKDQKNDEWKMLFSHKAAIKDLGAPAGETIARTEVDQMAASIMPDSEEIEMIQDEEMEDMTLWSNAWRVWLSIGTAATTPPESTDKSRLYVPSQPFLTALIQIFPALYSHIKSRFVTSDLQKLSTVLQRALSAPVHGDSTPFIMPVGEVSLTPLQDAILCSVKVLQQEVMSGSENLPTMYPDLFEQLLTLVEFAVRPPKFGKVDAKSISAVSASQQADWVAMNYVPFAEKILLMVVDLYTATANHSSVINNSVLQRIIKTLRVPLSLKYACPSPSTWILSINSLLTILDTGLPIARKHEAAFQGMWQELAQTTEEFFFCQQPVPPTLSVEDYQRNEALDCKLVELIRDDILPYHSAVPHSFTIHIMNVLNKGSIHSTSSSTFIDTDSSRKLREEFAKACFETLLQFSFVSRDEVSTEEGSVTKLAVTALLQRCRDVLTKYIEDERLSGKCPLPRPRMSEMTFVLKAVGTLLVALKKAPPSNVDEGIWQQVVDLYPALVECVSSTSPQVCRALKEVLQEYHHLLSTPSRSIINGAL